MHEGQRPDLAPGHLVHICHDHTLILFPVDQPGTCRAGILHSARDENHHLAGRLFLVLLGDVVPILEKQLQRNKIPHPLILIRIVQPADDLQHIPEVGIYGISTPANFQYLRQTPTVHYLRPAARRASRFA